MSVVNVKRDPKGTVGPVYTPEGATAQKRWTVLLDGADGIDDAPIAAAGATTVARLYESWSATEPWLRCTQIHPEPVSPFTLWTVTCQYATGPQSEDPLNEPPDVSDDSISLRELLEYDRNGTLIANTAGDPIEVEEDILLTVLRIGRNVSSHSYTATARYRNSVNQMPTLDAPPECLWMKDLRASKIITPGLRYWREEFEIVFNHLRQPTGETALNAPSSGYIGWSRRVANLGRRVWQEVDGGWELVNLQARGEPLSEPVPLTSDGTAALDKGAATIWLYFNTKPVADWSGLRLSLR
jgi:hypothetical protein